MRIERIEIRVTDLTTRLQRQRSTGLYDTGAPGTLFGKPVLVKIFAEGVVGYGQIRPLAPHHSMPDTYATMISMIKDIWGPRLIGQSIFDVESIHGLFDRLAPANYMARAAVDAAAVIFQQPNFFGVLEDVDALTDWAHAQGALVIAVVNPISLALLRPPGPLLGAAQQRV